MTQTAKALYSFFSSFGLPAYVVGCVPDDAELPYITYQLREPDWRTETQIYCEVWYRSTSMVQINAKTDEIRQAIGECHSIPTESGALYLTDFTAEQFPMEGDDTLKRMYITMTMFAQTN